MNTFQSIVARLLIVMLLAAALGACSGGRSGDGAIDLPGTDKPVATIDGEKIPPALYLATAQAFRLDASTPEGRTQTLQRLTDMVVLAHLAQREDFARDADFAIKAELGRLQATAGAAMQVLERRANIDDAAIKATYDKQAATSGGAEYDFTQLLFADEDNALKAEGEIIDGKPFAEVFDANRKDALQARSFNGARPNQLPEEIAAALAKLKPGTATYLPVHTRYGWHVLHLDATRPFTPPPLDSVKDGIRRSLAASFAESRLAKLRENAPVKLDQAALDAAVATHKAGEVAKSSATPSGDDQ